VTGGTVALPLSAAIGLAVWAFGARRGAGTPAGWFALAILGFGASLQLIDAPNVIAFQHLRVAGGTAWQRTAWAILLAQAILVVWRGRVPLSRAAADLRGLTTPVGWLAIGLALLLTAAIPSRSPATYAAEAALATFLELLALATVLAGAWSLPERPSAGAPDLVQRLLGPEAPGPRRVDRWILTVAAAVVVIAATLAVVVYERHPHVPDEVVYLVHASYLADGMLSMPLPPVPAAFHLDLMQYEPTRWFSPVPPGWPFVLAAGAWAGAPWLVNPLLGGLAVLLAYLWLGHLFDRRTTRLATLLCATSPWLLFMSMSFMTHQATLVFALAAALAVARGRENGSGAVMFAGGLALGAVSLIRPLEGLAVAALLGLWSLPVRGRRFRFTPSAALVAGSVVSGSLGAVYNAGLTGSPWRAPINAYIDRYYEPGSNDLGFGPNRGLGWTGLDPFPGHGPPDVAVNALINGAQVNVELTGWPTGAAVFIALALALAVGRRPMSRQDLWLAAVFLVVVGLHALYWFSGGPDFGARYWYLVLVPGVALVARALRPGAPVAGAVPPSAARLERLGLTLALVALTVFVPWRSSARYRHYRNMRADVRAMAGGSGLGRSLVLVRGRRHPDYASAAVYNPVDLAAPVPIFAWDATPAARAAVIRAYADRPVYFVDGPTLTRAGYRIRAGPLTATEALASPIHVEPAGDAASAYDPVTERRR
jgi:4-amino-4-deoxy-L-arabinose transferase-like glycosyltransferase